MHIHNKCTPFNHGFTWSLGASFLCVYTYMCICVLFIYVYNVLIYLDECVYICIYINISIYSV